MKIFIDTANIDEIRKQMIWASLPVSRPTLR